MSTMTDFLLGMIAVGVYTGLILIAYCAVALSRGQSVRQETLLAIKTLRGWAKTAEREVAPALAEVKAAVGEVKPQLDEMQQYQHKAKHDALDVAQTMISKLDVVERSMKSPPPGTLNVKDKPK